MRKLFTQNFGRQALALALVALGTFAMTAQMTLEVIAPSGISRTYEIGVANYGGNASPEVVGDLLITEDGTSLPNEGCNPITNDLTGRIALSDRGTCNFSLKAYNAQQAGAIAAIMCNNLDETFNMAAGDFAEDVTIPHVMLSSSDCQTIKNVMQSEPVTVRIFFDNWGFDDVLWGDGADGADFDEDFGTNGFTTEGLSDTAAVWTWAENPTTNGSCGSFRIQSPTGNNGAVFMDADGFLGSTNGGVGPCDGGPIAPVTSEVVSPVIDCSSFTAVALRWWEFNLPITTGESDTELGTSVSFSTDGGTTWSSPINVSPGSQQGTGGNFYMNAERQIIVIPEAIGAENFRFKFVYNRARGVYNWMVDDVALVQPPNYDPVLEDAFYTPLSYATPVMHIGTDTFGFSANVRNGGVLEDATFITTVQILNDQGTEMMLQTDERTVPALTRDTISFNSINVDYLPGSYTIRYTVAMDGVVDEVPGDEMIEYDFEITDSTFGKEYQVQADITSFVTPSIENNVDVWYWGPFYTISSAAGSTDRQFRGADIAVGASDGVLDTESFAVYLMKWEDTNNNYPDFATELNMPAVNPLDHPFMSIVAFASVDPSGKNQNELFSLNIADGVWFDDLGGILTDLELEAGFTYCLLGEFNEEQVGFSSGSGPNLPGAPGVLQNYNGTGEYFTGFTTTSPVARLKVSTSVSGAEDVELTDVQASVYPTLTNDFINVELNFDERTETHLTIVDMAGRVQTFTNLGDISELNQRIDVSKFNTGNYIVSIQTSLGEKQVPITVVK